MFIFSYSCRACGFMFESVVSTVPGPSLLVCESCDRLNAVRERPFPERTGDGAWKPAVCRVRSAGCRTAAWTLGMNEGSKYAQYCELARERAE